MISTVNKDDAVLQAIKAFETKVDSRFEAMDNRMAAMATKQDLNDLTRRVERMEFEVRSIGSAPILYEREPVYHAAAAYNSVNGVTFE